MKSLTTLHWARINTDTIEHWPDWRVTVVGSNASAKPTQWGVYERAAGSNRWIEARTNPSKRFSLGSHVVFDTQREAKEYVEWKITGKHPREAEQKAYREKLRALDAPFVPDPPKLTPEQARVVLLRTEKAMRTAMNKLNHVLSAVCGSELSPRSPEAKATEVGQIITELELTIGVVNEAVCRT